MAAGWSDRDWKVRVTGPSPPSPLLPLPHAVSSRPATDRRVAASMRRVFIDRPFELSLRWVGESSLHRPGHQAAGELPPQDAEEDDAGDGGEHGAGGERAEGDLALPADEHVEGDGQRVVL